jgi:oxygen-independent coproporphyrinogen-3 oxidase
MRQYEISNFAREGYASRHNMKYWRRSPYIGFGLDAHSMLPVGEDAVRFQNVDDLDVYMSDAAQGALALFGNKQKRPEREWIGRETAFEESLFLGLRLIEGVDFGFLREKFGEAMVAGAMPGLNDACEAGFLERHDDQIWLTGRGRLASNEVFSRLLVPATT